MENRVFICTHSQLPRGDANSNYIFYMASALANEGWNVVAIGKSLNQKREAINCKGIYCINLPGKKKCLNKMEGQLFFGQYVLKELRRQFISAEDYVLIYGGYLSIFSTIARNLNFLKRGHVATCVVEWPTKDQFRFGRIDPDYILWHRVFYKWMPYWSKIIVISKNLKKCFKGQGCSTFILPPLVDASPNNCQKQHSNNNKVHFIYSGNDTKKDAIKNMLLSLLELDDKEIKQIELHFTGLSEEKAKALLRSDAYLIEKFKNCLFIHGWVEFSDLEKIYLQSDYLLLAREENQFTISNFPSKVPEMMKYGIVPVCSNVGDYTENYLLDGKDSLVFQGASPVQCANAIRRAISITPERRNELKFNAMKKAISVFDYRLWGKSLTKFLIGEI